MIRESWASSFSRAGQELWKMESHGDVCLFMSKYTPAPIQINGYWEYMSRPAPKWHVWQGDNWLYCGPDMHAAYHIYQDITKGNQ